MVAPKPQIRSMFATPVCVHYLPVAQEFNAEMRPIIIERARLDTPNALNNHSQGWRSAPDFESWGGGSLVQTLFRVARELADSLTATRNGSRVTLDWKVQANAAKTQVLVIVIRQRLCIGAARRTDSAGPAARARVRRGWQIIAKLHAFRGG